MNYRINKQYGEEPTSFEDFVKRFLKKHPDKLAVCKRTIVPIYIVNKASGYMQEVYDADVFVGEHTNPHNICSICIYKKFTLITHFSVNHDDRYKDKLVDIVWGSLYSGNYELFLHQKDAAERSKEILMKKKEKFDNEINMLNILCGQNYEQNNI